VCDCSDGWRGGPRNHVGAAAERQHKAEEQSGMGVVKLGFSSTQRQG
jgi:hypothetical protein